MWKRCLKIVGVVALLTAIFIESYKNTYKYEAPDSTLASNWIQMFVDGSFSACDTLVKYSSDRISGGNDMYTLQYLVDLIQTASVEVQDGVITLVVSINQVGGSKDIPFNADTLSSYREDYLNGVIEDTELSSKLNDIYASTFESYIEALEVSGVTECRQEVEIVDGKLIGTYDLIQNLYISSGLLDSIQYFEDNAKSWLNVKLYS